MTRLTDILYTLTSKLELGKIYSETFINTIELIVKIFEIEKHLSPKINIDDYNHVSLEFHIKDRRLYFYINDTDYKISIYDRLNGYIQNLKLNNELFEWLWTGQKMDICQR